MGPRLSGRRLVLWRHGQTIWNAEGRYQGHTDVPLDESGIEQAERAARLLAALCPYAIVSSDLSRASETAETLSRSVGVPVVLDGSLRERFMAGWEGLTHEDIEDRFPDEWAARQPAGGETPEQVADRVAPAVEKHFDTLPPGGTLVVVSHGSALRLGMCRLLELPALLWSRIGPLANCSWSVLGQDGSGPLRLHEHNAGTLPEPVLSDDR